MLATTPTSLSPPRRSERPGADYGKHAALFMDTRPATCGLAISNILSSEALARRNGHSLNQVESFDTPRVNHHRRYPRWPTPDRCRRCHARQTTGCDSACPRRPGRFHRAALRATLRPNAAGARSRMAASGGFSRSSGTRLPHRLVRRCIGLVRKAAAHRHGRSVELIHRRQTQHQLDRADHAGLVVVGAVDRGAACRG